MQTINLQQTSEQKTSNDSSYYTLLFKGELDEERLTEMRQQIDPITDDANIKKVIFDFSELTFINSHALGFLVSVQTHLSKEGRKLVIVGASGTVMDVMTLIGLPSIITCARNVQEAIEK